MNYLDELLEDSENEFKEFQDNPELWEEREDVSEEVLPPEVSHLISDFEAGNFDYEKFLQLSTDKRKLFLKYISEHTPVEIAIREKTA